MNFDLVTNCKYLENTFLKEMYSVMLFNFIS